MNGFRWFAITLSVLVMTNFTTTGTAQESEIRLETELYASPQDGGVRRWQIQSATGLAFATGDVVTNLGCTTDAGALWCKVQPLRGGPHAFIAAQHLAPVAGPDGQIATGVNDSARRAKRKQFDVVDQIPCAQERGQALAPCPIGIARSVGGDVTAAVTFPAGFTRLLFFMHGEFISASATMSGAGRDTDWDVVNGIHKIRADDQRFEIRHKLLFGK